MNLMDSYWSEIEARAPGHVTEAVMAAAVATFVLSSFLPKNISDLAFYLEVIGILVPLCGLFVGDAVAEKNAKKGSSPSATTPSSKNKDISLPRL
jgi:hypothetical protein